MMDWNRGPGPIVAFIGVFFILILLKTLSQRDTGETFLGGLSVEKVFQKDQNKKLHPSLQVGPCGYFRGLRTTF
jgi:hypothetical protein